MGLSPVPARVVGVGRYDPALIYVPGGTMRHTTVTILLAATTLALAGCSSGSEPEKQKPSASATPSADPAVKFMSAIEDARLDSYATGIPAADELTGFPREWCTALDEGHSVEWMFDMTEGGLYPVGVDWGTEKSDAFELLVLGVKAYCPENSSVVLEELRASGEY